MQIFNDDNVGYVIRIACRERFGDVRQEMTHFFATTRINPWRK